jgi:hypothetical protein
MTRQREAPKADHVQRADAWRIPPHERALGAARHAELDIAADGIERAMDRAAATADPVPRRLLPYEKLKRSQARIDHLRALLTHPMATGEQLRVLRDLISSQQAALRYRVMALGHAHQAGYVVRSAPGGSDRRD